MRKLIRAAVFAVVLISILNISAEKVSAQATPTPVEYILPYPGILPDHPLYFIKKLRDETLLFFNRSPQKKVNILLLLADKKLVMGQMLLEEQKKEIAVMVLTEAENHFIKLIPFLIDMKDENTLPVNIIDKVELSIKKHKEIIDGLKSNMQNEDSNHDFEKVLNVNNQAYTQISSLKQ